MQDIQISIDLIQLMELSEGDLNALSTEEKKQVKDRYIKYLMLSKKFFDLWLAPTKDIDELWHLHMLCPVHYYNDCISNFGEILNHDYRGIQKPPVSHKEIILRTNKLWKKEFNEEMFSDGTNEKGKLHVMATSHGASFRPPFKSL